MCKEKKFKLFKIYSCPVMYLNKTAKNDNIHGNIKRRPVVLLNIFEEKESSYGLILGSASQDNKRSDKYILPWNLKVKDNITTSYFDFSRFIRTLDLALLGTFLNDDRKEVNLDSKLIKELKIKFNNLFSNRFQKDKNDPLNNINWHIYMPHNIKNEYDEILNFAKKFIKEPDYILILNRFYINSPNTLVIGLYLQKYTEHSIKIDLTKNYQLKNILYADLRTMTTVNISQKSLLDAHFTNLSINQVDFIKDAIKIKFNFKQNLSVTKKDKTNDMSDNLLYFKENPNKSVWDSPASTSKKVTYSDEKEWPKL